ncbi:MAG: hypothetical protein HZB99_00180 [Candidatus Harrisonbacteria bacterium]|nr:hypothetical protein [Candidatus Harrisonbacteria bacterium]
MERIVKVVEVLRDDRNRAIWVQIQYIKNGELLHDAVFMRGKDDRMFLSEKRIDNYIPPKRFKMMCDKAAAVIFDKRVKPAEQPNLPNL